MVDPEGLQEKLKVLSEAYTAQLPEKLGQVEQAWESLPRDVWDEEGFKTLHRMVHSLTGSGKTFGYAPLSEVARKLEKYLAQMAKAKAAPNLAQRRHTQALLRELHQVAAHRDVSLGSQPAVVTAAPYRRDAVGLRQIFIVEDDLELAEELKVQLGYFGYDVAVFGTLADFRFAMQQSPEAVVLMDITFPEDEWGGIHVMEEIQRGRDIPLPVLFMSVHHEFEARLEAVRAGSIAYLTKPVNIGDLIDKLDELTSTLPVSPYRILIVDDSVDLSIYYGAVLEQAGMAVKTVNNPFNVIEALTEFAPDLIMINIYMPQCNGMELAKVIRQMDVFVSVPIVFLSAESDLDKQLLAISMGGDDFLVKPVQPQHLVSSVTSRICRSLVLRSFMVRDSLTGLLNHSAIKDQLVREVTRAKRQGTPLAFAMIDIDHFKQVNDSYGHQAGDRVIKSLARILKQRLRETDLVGRYGGEEFAVILIDVDAAAAFNVLDTIRKDFAQLHHLADGKEFSVTFSCGVAEASNFDDANKLGDAADKALYKAKHVGRNQVMLA